MSRDVPESGAAHAVPPARSSPRLPIALRVPNPPPNFVGRHTESTRLTASLQSRRIAGIVGVEGIGKTALALQVIAAMQADGTVGPKATLVALNARPTGRLVTDLLDLLGRLEGLPPEWRVFGGDPNLSLATLIDLADQGPWTLLLDDCSLADPAEFALLVEAIARYSRRSRWLFTANSLPASIGRLLELVELGPLTPAEVVALRRQLLGNTDSLDSGVGDDSLTNPRALILAATGSASDTGAAADFLRVLAALERPLRHATLARVTRLPSPEQLQRLVEAGRVLELPRGLWRRREDTRANDAALAPEVLSTLASSLHLCPDDEARLEAARIWLALGETDRVVELLDTHAETLCENGYSGDVWHLLEHVSPAIGPGYADLVHWRRWAAFDWADPAAIADYGARDTIAPDTYVSKHREARLHLASGDFAAAIACAELAAQLAQTDVQHDRAIFRIARCMISLGRPDDAVGCLQRCRTATPEMVAERAVVRGDALGMLGRGDEANEIFDELLGRLDEFDSAIRLRILLGAARVRLVTQRLLAAERIVDLLLSARTERSADGVSARTALEFAATIAVQRGRFAHLREIARRLLSFEKAHPVRSLFVRSFLVNANAWQRTTEEFRRSLEHLYRDASGTNSPIARDIECYAQAQFSQLALLEGTRFVAPTNGYAIPVVSWLTTSRDAVTSVTFTRWGGELLIRDDAPADSHEHAVLFARARGEHALAQGHAEQALAHFDDALAIATTHGYALHVLELYRSYTLAAMCANDPERLRRAAAQYAAAGGDEAPRAVEEAEFYAAVADKRVTPELLQRWADDSRAVRTRTRWAQWLLGGDAPVDPVEHRELQRWLDRSGLSRGRALTADGRSSTPWRPGWGLDATKQTVWGAGEIVADLGRHDVLWAILSTLASLGGEASKEELVTSVWQVHEYHPLNHDNRLRVAVKKLRNALQRDGAPASVETTADGYSLAGVWRVWGG